jgi:DNA replication protein DnaC
MESQTQLHSYLQELCLPHVRECYPEVARQAIAEGLSYEQFLLEVVAREVQSRRQHRIERLRHESRLPSAKTLARFDQSRLPGRVRQQVAVLREGGFLDRRENVLAFGNPGSGKTHLLCGVCHELVEHGRRVLYTTCSLLVQELLIAKRDLKLASLLKRLGKYEGLLIDDLGYVQQSREEMEVLFTLLSERYERASVLITSNLPFSGWDVIFKDPMTTAAAIDRLVHHSVILELNVPSYRMEQAKEQSQVQAEARRGEASGEGGGIGVVAAGPPAVT